MSARAVAKRALEWALVGGGAAALARRRRAGVLVLAYHNVVPDGYVVRGERSLHLTRARFARQLDQLMRTHDVIPLAEVPARAPGARPAAAITFDDAYRGAVTVGAAEVAARGLAATIFVAPAFVGGGQFWWDALADPATGELDERVRAFALDALAGRDAAVRTWAAGAGRVTRGAGPEECVATEAELARAAALPGITLGSHSWSHPNLARLPDGELDAELARPLAWLRARYASPIPWLSYPYGCSNRAVERAAEAAGYAGAVRITGGWVRDQDAGGRFALPRFNVPAGLSHPGFILRAAGIGSA